MVALPIRNLAHDGLELFLQRFHVLGDFFPIGFGEPAEHVGIDHLAIVGGRQGQPHRRADQRDAFLLGAALQSAEGVVGPLLEFLIQHVAAGAVIVALEGRRQGDLQIGHQPLHRLPERPCAPGRQHQATGLMRIGEVVDVAPIGRRRLGRRFAPQQLLHQRVLAGPARS